MTTAEMLKALQDKRDWCENRKIHEIAYAMEIAYGWIRGTREIAHVRSAIDSVDQLQDIVTECDRQITLMGKQCEI